MSEKTLSGTKHETITFGDYVDFNTDKVKLMPIKGLNGQSINFNDPATFTNIEPGELDVYVRLEQETLNQQIESIFGNDGDFVKHYEVQQSALVNNFSNAYSDYREGQTIAEKGWYESTAGMWINAAASILAITPETMTMWKAYMGAEKGGLKGASLGIGSSMVQSGLGPLGDFDMSWSDKNGFAWNMNLRLQYAYYKASAGVAYSDKNGWGGNAAGGFGYGEYIGVEGRVDYSEKEGWGGSMGIRIGKASEGAGIFIGGTYSEKKGWGAKVSAGYRDKNMVVEAGYGWNETDGQNVFADINLNMGGNSNGAALRLGFNWNEKGENKGYSVNAGVDLRSGNMVLSMGMDYNVSQGKINGINAGLYRNYAAGIFTDSKAGFGFSYRRGQGYDASLHNDLGAQYKDSNGQLVKSGIQSTSTLSFGRSGELLGGQSTQEMYIGKAVSLKAAEEGEKENEPQDEGQESENLDKQQDSTHEDMQSNNENEESTLGKLANWLGGIANDFADIFVNAGRDLVNGVSSTGQRFSNWYNYGVFGTNNDSDVVRAQTQSSFNKLVEMGMIEKGSIEYYENKENHGGGLTAQDKVYYDDLKLLNDFSEYGIDHNILLDGGFSKGESNTFEYNNIKYLVHYDNNNRYKGIEEIGEMNNVSFIEKDPETGLWSYKAIHRMDKWYDAINGAIPGGFTINILNDFIGELLDEKINLGAPINPIIARRDKGDSDDANNTLNKIDLGLDSTSLTSDIVSELSKKYSNTLIKGSIDNYLSRIAASLDLLQLYEGFTGELKDYEMAIEVLDLLKDKDKNFLKEIAPKVELKMKELIKNKSIIIKSDYFGVPSKYEQSRRLKLLIHVDKTEYQNLLEYINDSKIKYSSKQ